MYDHPIPIQGRDIGQAGFTEKGAATFTPLAPFTQKSAARSGAQMSLIVPRIDRVGSGALAIFRRLALPDRVCDICGRSEVRAGAPPEAASICPTNSPAHLETRGCLNTSNSMSSILIRIPNEPKWRTSPTALSMMK